MCVLLSTERIIKYTIENSLWRLKLILVEQITAQVSSPFFQNHIYQQAHKKHTCLSLFPKFKNTLLLLSGSSMY